MLTILYTAAKKFPAGPVRNVLAEKVPLYSWTAGEDDDGSPQCAVDYGSRPILLIGRSAAEAIFIEIMGTTATDGSLPPHAMRVTVRRPSTDNDILAERIGAIVASTLAFIDKNGVKVRFDGWDHWFGLEETVLLASDILEGRRLASAVPAPKAEEPAPTAPPPSDAQASGPLTSRIAGLPIADRLPRERSAILGFDTLIMATTEQTMSQVLSQRPTTAGLVSFGTLPDFHAEQVSANRLPTLAVLFDRYADLDRAKLAEILTAFDADGGWTVEAAADSGTLLHGRGGSIELTIHDQPLPAWMVELALDRSLGATPGEPLARLRGHRRYLAIRPQLDCTAASWLDIRQTAKAMVCALAVAARPQHDHGAYSVGLLNAATSSCFTDDMLDDLVGALAQNEVSIKTFVWHAFPATATGHVSMSSAGLLPFIGREVEILDAPGPIEHVGGQLNNIERYLLINGPVMGDGDTIGDEADEPLARAWHAVSDAHGRDQPVPVLRFEIRGPDGRWRPRPDAPRGDPPLGTSGQPFPPREPATAPVHPSFGRRPVFGRKTG